MENEFTIILVGPPGCGKTLLAEELKDVLIRYGVTAVTSVQRIPEGGDWSFETTEWDVGK